MPRKGSPVSRAANPAETIWLSRSPESTASTPPGGRPAFSMLFSTAQSSILRSARSNVLSPNISSVSARSTYSPSTPAHSFGPAIAADATIFGRFSKNTVCPFGL